jgi:tellurite resistance-related uncharacterized protein
MPIAPSSASESCVRPADAKRYFEGPAWEAAAIPPRLLDRHRLKSGAWGELVVLEGQVRLRYETPVDRVVTVAAGEVACIPPDVDHRLELLGDVRLRLDFYREDA